MQLIVNLVNIKTLQACLTTEYRDERHIIEIHFRENENSQIYPAAFLRIVTNTNNVGIDSILLTGKLAELTYSAIVPIEIF